ncbi:MAG: hypothetical protein KGL39_15225 [Patescibacteria group bacterium]|nr:hypothetical protein [Patescibacteria group bacterium]
MRKLTNTVDSISELSPNHRKHGTRIGDLVAPNQKWSLEGLRRAVRRS